MYVLKVTRKMMLEEEFVVGDTRIMIRPVVSSRDPRRWRIDMIVDSPHVVRRVRKREASDGDKNRS